MTKIVRFAISAVVFFGLYLLIELTMFDREGGLMRSLTAASVATAAYFVILLLLDSMFGKKQQKKPPSHRPPKKWED
ncbi:MAG: hypothetical protein FWE32_02545 [Oscillospiraceae bacterium]|nr:hypothetical protein [Oscillospiraceae bacterium]